MSRRTSHGYPANPFNQPDPSIYMLGLPRSHPRLGRWALFVFFAGVLAALLIVGLTNFIQ